MQFFLGHIIPALSCTVLLVAALASWGSRIAIELLAIDLYLWFYTRIGILVVL